MKRIETKQLEEPLLDSEAEGGDECYSKTARIFKVNKKQLMDLFCVQYKDKDGKSVIEPVDTEQAIVQLRELGSQKEILKSLATDQMTGIIGDGKDLARRAHVFGHNQKPFCPPASILDSIWETLQEPLWIVVFITGGIAALFGLFVTGFYGLLEGFAIIFTALFLISITSAADWYKDTQFVELSKIIKEENIPVIRGKAGSSQSLSVWDVVVGDIIILNTGQGVPADCLVIESVDLKIDMPKDVKDQNEYDTGKRKNSNDDPFLKAGSLIVRGQCKAVVCAVGANSSRGIKEEKLNVSESTPIQRKLRNLKNRFTCFAIISSLTVLACLIIFLIINMGTSKSWIAVLLDKLPKSANIVVVMFVVITPEGLPLTVGVSLAFTVMRMYKQDKILVRNLDAPEKMGMVNELLVGKTGTLTQGNMKVSKFLCEGQVIKNTRKNTLTNCQLSNDTLHRIYDSILFNGESRVEMDVSNYNPVGNTTECALMRFLQDADLPIHRMIAEKYKTYDVHANGKTAKLPRIKAVSPFNSSKNRSAVALVHPFRDDYVSIYVKGAPEKILEMSQTFKGHSAEELPLDTSTARAYADKISEMAQKPLRVIAFGYAEMPRDVWEQTYDGQNGKEFEDSIDEGDFNLTFLAAIGLKDPIRPRVSAAIDYAQKGGISIRLVSGDHLETAKKVALRAGILTPKDLDDLAHPVLTGEKFRSMAGGIIRQANFETGDPEFGFENQGNFEDIVRDLKVLCRSTNQDKETLVKGLQLLGNKVAVTGDGINDVDALQAADVGLAMGSGCTAARYASDLILTDNDFEAAIKAVMWGRNIYHNITRFLQFQITVNISVLVVVIFGIFFYAESPLSAIQLLWVNLIMDSGAALALATEPPLKTILKGQPSQSLLNNVVWRQILGISIWNFLVLILLMIFGKEVVGLKDFNNYVIATTSEPSVYRGSVQSKVRKYKTDKAEYDDAQAKLRLFTIIFTTFVFLQVFNEINCRKIGQRDFNVFDHFWHNWWFIGILIFICVVQYIQIQWFHALTRTHILKMSEWGGCIIIGMTSLLISLLLKMTPSGFLKIIPFEDFVNEDVEEDSQFVKLAQDGNLDNFLGNEKKDREYEPVQEDEGYTNL